MSRQGNDEDDLDEILDSALEEFDVGPVDAESVLGPGGGDTNGNSVGRTRAVGSAQQNASTFASNGSVEGPRQEPEHPPGRSIGDDEGLRAIEEALKKLNHLQVHISEDVRAEGEHTEEEDLKLVEDFLKSLSSQFEGVGHPGDTNRSSDGEIPDDLTRELAAIFSGTDNPTERVAPGAATSSQTNSQRSENATGGASNWAARSSSGDGASASTASGTAGPSTPGPEFEKIVESVVGELLSKDVLKGPMEEMQRAYEQWLPENEERLSQSEVDRYRKQQVIVGKICVLYENGKDDPPTIMGLLQEMQDTGAPPNEVIRKLGVEDDDAAGGAMPAGPLSELEALAKCPVQ